MRKFPPKESPDQNTAKASLDLKIEFQHKPQHKLPKYMYKLRANIKSFKKPILY